MTEYNRIAWDRLTELTGLSISQLEETVVSLGITTSTNTFINWRNYGTIAPEDLVTICNHFRFPVSYFLRVVGRESEKREYRIFSEEEWQVITLNTANLIDHAVSAGRQLRRDAIRKIGCSAAYYDALRKYPSVPLPQKLSMTDLLEYINNVKMYTGDVIIDHNELCPMEYSVMPWYDDPAKKKYSIYYPQPKTTFVAEEVIDLTGFLMRYVQTGRMEGDERLMAIRMKTLNEISDIITGLRNELFAEKQHRMELQEELNELKSCQSLTYNAPLNYKL